jgi:hypothetical protein
VGPGTAKALVVIALACLGPACSDLFDVDLAKQTVAADFGPSPGTVPSIACDASTAEACGPAGPTPLPTSAVAGGGAPLAASVTLACDPGTGHCYAQASGSIAFSLEVLQADDLGTRLARHSLGFVHAVDIGYTAPTNTLTFAVPSMDVLVGPAGTTDPAAAGVATVGTIGPFPAGTPFTDRRHLVLSDGSPARALVESSVNAKEPFVLLVTFAPRFDAGAPLPGGAFEVDLYPRIEIGL